MNPCQIRPYGFTLIEFLVAIVIAGILAGAAYPAYTRQIQKSRRADAVAAITALTQAQERYRMSHPTYSDDTGKLGVDVAKIAKHYSIAITGDAGGSLENYFRITATPISGGLQASDSDCARLMATLARGQLDYTASDASGSTDTTSKCWAK